MHRTLKHEWDTILSHYWGVFYMLSADPYADYGFNKFTQFGRPRVISYLIGSGIYHWGCAWESEAGDITVVAHLDPSLCGS